ncbi:MAG: hypothetical protein BGP24_00205 [Lysobacterales bacterium 69-70]|nr:hypothetical protein [Xanthomonadaceae bacterium]ODU33776.1 MAG: hypothetical protein ABS97_10640 [Xanthomonadaceae bacterium SCN 69-320]ODV21050.1 MAG: hypothetical protein ABT27_05830 [Xanthomonadaceae bacterium SCN 69-25]OJY99278.1 MAG: hypothetical protein BGP24_00205 [Xanthomonadales bacterium 69-70]
MRISRSPMLRAAIALATAFAASGAAAEPYVVGGRTLQLPAPPTLTRISGSLPQLLQSFEGYAPAEGRVIDVYVTPDDHAVFVAGGNGELLRYAQLGVQRASETKPLSAIGFRANLDLMERALEQSMPKVADETRKQSAKGDAVMKEIYGTEITTSISDIGYHGVYRREKWGLFFTATAAVDVNGQPHPIRVFTASSFAMIDNRFMTFSVYSEDEPPARAWARHTLDTWVDAAHAANPDDFRQEVQSLFGVAPAAQRPLLVLAVLFAVVAPAVVVVVLLRRRRALRGAGQRR